MPSRTCISQTRSISSVLTLTVTLTRTGALQGGWWVGEKKKGEPAAQRCGQGCPNSERAESGDLPYKAVVWAYS